MANETEKKILATLPWSNLISEFSYAGVAVFDVDKYYVIVPLKNQEEFVDYCKIRAAIVGDKKINSEEWKSYNIKYKFLKKWPYIVLKGKK